MQTRDFLRAYESATNTERAKLTRLHEEASEDVAGSKERICLRADKRLFEGL